MSVAKAATLKLSDPGNMAEYFAYGIGRVDLLGSCVRLTFYTPRMVGTRGVNEIAFSVIVPADQVPVIVSMLAAPRETRANPLTVEAQAHGECESWRRFN